MSFNDIIGNGFEGVPVLGGGKVYRTQGFFGFQNKIARQVQGIFERLELLHAFNDVVQFLLAEVLIFYKLLDFIFQGGIGFLVKI